MQQLKDGIQEMFPTLNALENQLETYPKLLLEFLNQLEVL